MDNDKRLLKKFGTAAQQIVTFGSFAYQQGWVPATSGNFSLRCDHQTIAITSSGKHKGCLIAEDILALALNGRVLGGAFPHGQPSAETGLHLQLYRRFPNIQAVLHVHSMAAVVLSRLIAVKTWVIEGHELLKALPGKSSHLDHGVVPIVDNDQDIARLANKVAPYLAISNGVHAYIIRGHGLYVWAEDLSLAKRYLEALDWLMRAQILEGSLI